ncbi:hypothetical protein A6S26_05280 [Nostoc sp. ATCC 43529]|nr:hypothetical protein A6S26_05280 [Nostoc sp. ATCC 43529]
MRYAVVEDAIVVNVIVLDDPDDYQTDSLMIPSETAGMGDIWNGTSFTRPAAPKPDPDWGAFNRAILPNAAYNRMSESSTNRGAVRRLESIAISAGVSGSQYENYDIIAMLWNAMIDGVPILSKPSSQEIAGWNAIALAAFMPFSFDASGKMVV